MIKVGDSIPNTILKTMGKNGPQACNLSEQLANKKAVLFAVPGAFTPTCSASHLPGFVDNYDQLTTAGIDLIACISVNDAFVMHAWGESANAHNILMLGDGNATFTNAIGLEKDASKFDMGIRSRRYAMIIDNGVITHLAIDDSGLENTSAEAILKQL